MNFIDEIFDLFRFTSEQRQMALNDLEVAIKAKVTNELLNELPSEPLREVKKITDIDSPEVQEKISNILKQNFSWSKIKEEEQKAIGQIIFLYLDFMLAKTSNEDKEKARAIFVKYGVRISSLELQNLH